MEREPKAPTQGEEAGRPQAAEPERDPARTASILESLLLVSSQPLPHERIARLLGGLSRQEVREAVDALKAKYPPDSSGILVEEVARGLQLRTNPANQEYVRRLFETRPPRFSRPALETLAVVAYRQPVTRLEIEQIRGVDCAAALKTLMERRLVRVVGKKNVAGRPFLFGTTREFLEVFSLGSLSELPSMRDIEDFLAARTGHPPPDRGMDPDLFGEAGPMPGAGAELAEELEEAFHGEPLVAIVNELPAGVSDDVLVEAASLGEAVEEEMKPLSPPGTKGLKFSPSGEHHFADPAEPLVGSSPDMPEWEDDPEPDRTED